jgi:hypothetical protein
MRALLLAPAEGFGLRPRPSKKELFMLIWSTLGHFWCSVITSVTFTSNPNNFFFFYKKIPQEIQKNSKKSKISNNLKNTKNQTNSDKISKNRQKPKKSIK